MTIHDGTRGHRADYVVAESLTNVSRHAEASRATVPCA
jgi:signal transduction histidine kinase